MSPGSLRYPILANNIHGMFFESYVEDPHSIKSSTYSE